MCDLDCCAGRLATCALHDLQTDVLHNIYAVVTRPVQDQGVLLTWLGLWTGSQACDRAHSERCETAQTFIANWQAPKGSWHAGFLARSPEDKPTVPDLLFRHPDARVCNAQHPPRFVGVDELRAAVHRIRGIGVADQFHSPLVDMGNEFLTWAREDLW